MHADVRHALLLQGRDEGHQVALHAVHAAVGDQAHEMRAPGTRHRRLGQVHEGGVDGQGAVLDGQIDAHDVLIDDASGPEVEVPDLGVAHLSVGQAHVAPHALQFPAGVFGQEPVHVRGPGQAHGVARSGRGLAPAVEDQEHAGLLHHFSPARTASGSSKSAALE
ncbi:hypothetical protein DSECCO2_586260 [anaerobic digester metagenome]